MSKAEVREGAAVASTVPHRNLTNRFCLRVIDMEDMLW